MSRRSDMAEQVALKRERLAAGTREGPLSRVNPLVTLQYGERGADLTTDATRVDPTWQQAGHWNRTDHWIC